MTRIGSRLRAALAGISGIVVTRFDRDDAIARAWLAPKLECATATGMHVRLAHGNAR